MNFQTMHKQRKFIMLAAALGIIAAFLPWQTVSAGIFGASISSGVNGFHGIAILAFLCFIAAGIVSLTGDQTKPLVNSSWMGALILGAIAIICVAVAMFNTNQGFGFVEVGIGVGCWIALAAALGVTGSAWLLKSPGDNLKAGIDSIKKTVATATTTTTPPPINNTKANVDKIAELERLVQLKDSGNISEEEYQQMKSKLL